jgi:hypothetical protein
MEPPASKASRTLPPTTPESIHDSEVTGVLIAHAAMFAAAVSACQGGARHLLVCLPQPGGRPGGSLASSRSPSEEHPEGVIWALPAIQTLEESPVHIRISPVRQHFYQSTRIICYQAVHADSNHEAHVVNIVNSPRKHG